MKLVINVRMVIIKMDLINVYNVIIAFVLLVQQMLLPVYKIVILTVEIKDAKLQVNVLIVKIHII